MQRVELQSVPRPFSSETYTFFGIVLFRPLAAQPTPNIRLCNHAFAVQHPVAIEAVSANTVAASGAASSAIDSIPASVAAVARPPRARCHLAFDSAVAAIGILGMVKNCFLSRECCWSDAYRDGRVFEQKTC